MRNIIDIWMDHADAESKRQRNWRIGEAACIVISTASASSILIWVTAYAITGWVPDVHDPILLGILISGISVLAFIAAAFARVER